MIAGIFIFLMGVSGAQEAGLSTVLENRKGIEALKKDNPSEANQHFLQSLSKDPLDARIQLNLGYSFEKMGQADKARAAYDTAAKLGKDDEVLFSSHFNRGVLYQKENKKSEAIAAYQDALKYNPDSVEAKTNIELLTKDDGQGKDDKQDQKKDGQEGSDKKDQKQGDSKDQQQDKDKQDNNDGKDQKDKPKEYAKNKPQPKPFKSEQLTQGDVNKILGEIKQQEQKIRAEFNKKEIKEKDLDKDW